MAQLTTGTEKRQTLEGAMELARPNFLKLMKDKALVERFEQVAIQAYKHAPGLAKCSPQSVFASIYEAAQQGLELDPNVGHAYLVPRWNGKARKMECQMQRGYRGVISLALADPKWDRIEAHLVYEEDEFAYQFGTEPGIIHRPCLTDRGDPTHGYAIAFGPKGTQFIAMSIDQLTEIRDNHAPRNKSGEIVGPWVKHFEEMCKKTLIHRLGKTLDLKPRVLSQLIADENRTLGITAGATDMPDKVAAYLEDKATKPAPPLKSGAQLAASISIPGEDGPDPAGDEIDALEAEPVRDTAQGEIEILDTEVDDDPGPPPHFDKETGEIQQEDIPF